MGTFSAEGTFDGVIPYLAELRELGVTAIELMPVATFPGERGWGYDGLYAYAPHPAYGGPEGLARLVAAAHREGLGVVLDVVYNHLGPGSEALTAFGPYLTDRVETLWGAGLDFSRARRPRVGDPERAAVGRGLRDRRPAARRGQHDRGRPGAARPRRACRPRARDRAARARDLGDRRRRRPADRGVGPRRALVGRVAPRAARAPDRRARGLLRAVRRRSTTCSPSSRAGRRNGTSSACRTTTRSATGPSATAFRPTSCASPPPSCSSRRRRPSCSWARSTASPSRSSSSPTTSRPSSRRRRGRAASASSPGGRPSRARTSPTRRTVETFLRSKLSRRVTPGLRDHYRRLLSLRRTLPREVQAEAHGRTLTMRRGDATLIADFDARTVELRA